MLDGVTIVESKAQKDELLLTGNDIENVSQSGSSSPFVGNATIYVVLQPHRFRVSAAYGTRIFVNF